MAERVRVGIIGAGGIANAVHMPSLNEIPECEVVAICDLIEEKAKKLADKYGVKKTYTSYNEMFKNETLDAVYVLVQPDLTYRVAYDTINAGYHVMIEKPMGINSYQANSLARAAARSGKIVAVAMNRRHIPVIQEAWKRVTAVSEITEIDGRFMKFSNIAAGWHYASAYNCDIVHAIDLVRYIAQSEPKSAGTVIGRFDSPVDNAWLSAIEFENGILATLRANYQSSCRVHDLEIHGPKASAYINIGFGGQECEADILYGAGVSMYSSASTGVARETREHIDGIALAGGDKYYQYYGYKSEDQNFIHAIQNGTQPLCTAADAAKTMEMVEFLLKKQVN